MAKLHAKAELGLRARLRLRIDGLADLGSEEQFLLCPMFLIDPQSDSSPPVAYLTHFQQSWCQAGNFCVSCWLKESYLASNAAAG